MEPSTDTVAPWKLLPDSVAVTKDRVWGPLTPSKLTWVVAGPATAVARVSVAVPALSVPNTGACSVSPVMVTLTALGALVLPSWSVATTLKESVSVVLIARLPFAGVKV